MPELQILTCERVDDALMAAFDRLLPQLNRHAPRPDRSYIERIVDADCVTLLLAREGDAVCGMLALALYPVPTGVRAHIEDVIVDGDARARGVGEALVRAALDRAAAAGARTVDLTSHASREAANRLYVRLGFTLRETNAYRYIISPND